MPTAFFAGIDFTCNPSRASRSRSRAGASPAAGCSSKGSSRCPTLAAFEAWLQTPGPWLGAFDFPFGLPRVFVDSNRLGSTCAES
jgi:hypothetical protein